MCSKCVCLFSVGARMVFTCFYQPFETLMILMEVIICTAAPSPHSGQKFHFLGKKEGMTRHQQGKKHKT